MGWLAVDRFAALELSTVINFLKVINECLSLNGCLKVVAMEAGCHEEFSSKYKSISQAAFKAYIL